MKILKLLKRGQVEERSYLFLTVGKCDDCTAVIKPKFKGWMTRQKRKNPGF